MYSSDSNLKLNKSKSRIKNNTEVTLKLSWNVVGDSNDETHFPHKLLLTNTLVLRNRKAFSNNSSAYTKLSKTQLYKMGQSGGLLGRLLGPLQKTDLMKNVLKQLGKSVLISLGLTVAASTTYTAIHKKCLGLVRQY